MQKRPPVTQPPERAAYRYGTLEAWADFLAGFTPPAGAFDARGPWKQAYRVWLSGIRKGATGFCEIERRPEGDGVALTAATRLEHSNGSQEQRFSLRCGAGEFAPLRSIQVESVSLDKQRRPVAAGRISFQGEVRGGAIEWQRPRGRRAARSTDPLISNWGLFDLVQRMKPGARPVDFTLLDDGDLVKPGQRIEYIGRRSVAAAGGEISLDLWAQTGCGVLPMHYWVDGQGRLLFAVAGQRAYLYDSGAERKA